MFDGRSDSPDFASQSKTLPDQQKRKRFGSVCVVFSLIMLSRSCDYETKYEQPPETVDKKIRTNIRMKMDKQTKPNWKPAIKWCRCARLSISLQNDTKYSTQNYSIESIGGILHFFYFILSQGIRTQLTNFCKLAT